MLNNESKNTKKLLAESFKKQLLKHPFEKITIKMITDDAGVIRPTFYNYYRDKYEVFEHIIDEELMGVAYALIDNSMEREAIKMVFTYFGRNRFFYQEAFKVEGQNSFEGILFNRITGLFKKIIKKHTTIENDSILTVENLARYYSTGMVYILKMWLFEERFLKVTPEEMFNAYMFIITHSILEIIHQQAWLSLYKLLYL